jgi:thiazole synthase
MHWLDERTIDVGRGQRLNGFWHCFGAYATKIKYDQIVQMLMASKTALFPLNTHRMETDGLVIGDGAVTWEQLRHLYFVDHLVPCLNINLRKTAADAVSVTKRAFAWSGVDLLKLEVLNSDDESVADDEEVTAAAEELIHDGFRVMPLITASYDVAKQLCDAGVTVLRVQGSPIGSGRGIDDPDEVSAICSLPVPVVLDCGIGSADHVREAFRLGCRGFLVDWMLFKDEDPVGAIYELKRQLQHIPACDGRPCVCDDAEGQRAWREWADVERQRRAPLEATR